MFAINLFLHRFRNEFAPSLTNENHFSSYNRFMCKVQGYTDRLTILLFLSPVVLQVVAFFYPKAEIEGHNPIYSQILLDIHTDPTIHD